MSANSWSLETLKTRWGSDATPEQIDTLVWLVVERFDQTVYQAGTSAVWIPETASVLVDADDESGVDLEALRDAAIESVWEDLCAGKLHALID